MPLVRPVPDIGWNVRIAIHEFELSRSASSNIVALHNKQDQLTPSLARFN